MNAAGGQIQGARRRQEDTWHIERYGEDELLAVIADGLGGHPAGDVASREGVREFVEQFSQRRLRATLTPRQWLQDSMLATDACLQDMTRKNRALREMATTMVVLYLHKLEFWAASVGDSYLLLLRDKQLIRLNELHSEGGGVTSCVGFNLSRVDIADRLPAAEGDRFLLATDGLITLDDAEVTAFLSGPRDASTAVHDLLAAVEHAELPGQDNATAVAILL
jgi:PPM family protein phosphatase